MKNIFQKKDKQFICRRNSKEKTNFARGFSLIELIVALGIFTSIVTVLLGALLVTMNSAKHSRALRTAMDNINFATESMTRSIRMGTNYYCVEGDNVLTPDMSASNEATKDCDNGSFISFIPKGESDATSRVGFGIISDDNGNSTLNRCTESACVAIVSPDVEIQKLKFVVKNSDLQKGQASAYIIMKGVVYVGGSPVSFAIQTMASQRNF